MGGDAANAAKAYQCSLNRFDDLLAHCGVKLPRAGRTSILSIPASIAAGSGDRIAEVRGPLNTASTLSEILLLEYAEGMPFKDVGWGCVDGVKVREFIDLHTAASELFLRPPAVAAPQARELLHVISASLEQAAGGHAIAGAEGKPGDRLLVLVGHDTNLTNLAGALQLEWLIDGRRNDTPPGSALIFQLWRDRNSGAQTVRVSFTAQTLEQMRNAEPLSLHDAPQQVSVFVSGCSREDSSCGFPHPTAHGQIDSEVDSIDAPFSLESVARYAVGDYLQPGVLAGQLLERTRTSKWRMVPSFFWMLLRNGIKYVSSRRNLTRFVSPPLSPHPR